MATKVHMEALSPTMEEGQLVKWLKQEGDAVSEGDVLAEIETDKATMELVARGSGVLRDVRVKEGDTAPVGEVIAMIGGEGEAAEGAGDDAGRCGDDAGGDEPVTRPAGGDDAAGDDAAGPDGAPARPAREAVGSEASGRPARQESKTPADEGTGARKSAPGAEPSEVRDSEADAGEEGQDAEPGRGARKAGDGGRVKASPLARRMAEESGIDIESVEGTGPAGRITKRDIEAAVQDGAAEAKGDDASRPREQRAAATDEAPGAEREAPQAERDDAAPAEREAAPARAPRPAGADSEEVPVTQMRKTIAKRLVQSIGPVPTFYLTIEVDMTRLMELRARANRHLERDGVKASINDFIIKALAEALKRHPEVNASWSDSAITRHHRVHVGVAVAVEDGLMTPVIRDADTRRIRDIAVDVKELAARAREKKLKPDEYTGATFSISNLGMFGITEFTAIINPPEAGIIAVGAVEEKPVVEDGAVVVRPRMRMTMSCDHRVVDGATGARFLQTLRELVEDPVMILA
jgi:pyruvate dehydrogenase E2 component (dihydrolipoamide acetyltransferase)